MARKPAKSQLRLFEGWTFTSRNYLLFGLGIVTILVGYFVLASGDVSSFSALTVAPILLFLGYVVIIPISLLYRDKSAMPPGESAGDSLTKNQSSGS